MSALLIPTENRRYTCASSIHTSRVALLLSKVIASYTRNTNFVQLNVADPRRLRHPLQNMMNSQELFIPSRDQLKSCEMGSNASFL